MALAQRGGGERVRLNFAEGERLIPDVTGNGRNAERFTKSGKRADIQWGFKGRGQEEVQRGKGKS